MVHFETNVDIQDGSYGRLSYNRQQNDWDFIPYGRAVILEQIKKNIETSEHTLLLSWKFQNESRFATISRGDLSEFKNLKPLIDKGADIVPASFAVFLDSIRYQEELMASNNIGMQLVYEKLGWFHLPMNNGKKTDTKLCYRLNGLIGSDLKARNVGALDTRKKGSFEGWRAFVKSEVIGHPVLELVLIASLSAITNALLSERFPTENPILHLNTASGKGKTTAAYLAVSPYGIPYEGAKSVTDKYGVNQTKHSLFQSWSATDNALIQTLSGTNGVVTVLNELGKSQIKDATRTIFDFSEGSNKARLNGDMKVVLTEKFSTVFISTGESSLLDRCRSKYEGLAIRVMEITDPLTESAEHANCIKEGSEANCGYAASAMVKYIIKNGGADYIYEKFKEWKDTLNTEMPSSYNKERFVEKFAALFMMTAEIATEALGITFSLDAIKNYLVEYDRDNSRKRNTSEASYDAIIEECQMNSALFYQKGCSEPPACQSKECWGRISKCDYTLPDGRIVILEYELYEAKVKELVAKHGYQNLRTCAKAWKEKGYLDYEEGRYTRTRKINPLLKTSAKVYVFRVFANEEEQAKRQKAEEERQKKLELTKMEIRNCEKRIHDLLNDDEEDNSHE